MLKRPYTPAAETDIRDTFRWVTQEAGAAPRPAVRVAPEQQPLSALGQLAERIYRQGWADGRQHGLGIGEIRGFVAGALLGALCTAGAMLARAKGWL